ncbi:MAG: DivIVA domain-containing protein [Acidobacteriota bacterium]
MSITPLDIRKMSFTRKMRGIDPGEVEEFLDLVAEELTGRLGDLSRLDLENRTLKVRLEDSERRQKELQESLLHAQKLSKEITDNAKREAELLLREAQVTSDDMIHQAIERANKVEARITELRATRRDLHLKLRNSLDLFSRILEADMEEERSTAVVRTLPRRKSQSS